MYDPKISLPTKLIEQRIEICKVFNLNFRPVYKFPYNTILRLYLYINHEIIYFFLIFLNLFGQSTKPNICKSFKIS